MVSGPTNISPAAPSTPQAGATLLSSLSSVLMSMSDGIREGAIEEMHRQFSEVSSAKNTKQQKKALGRLEDLLLWDTYSALDEASAEELEGLKSFLKSPEASLRAAGLGVVARLKSRAKLFTTDLLYLARTETEPEVMAPLIDALAAAGQSCKESHPWIIECYKHDDPDVRNAAAGAFTALKFDPLQTVPLIKTRLESSRSAPAYEEIKEIERCGAKARDLIPCLEEIVKDPRSSFRELISASRALLAVGIKSPAAAERLVRKVDEVTFSRIRKLLPSSRRKRLEALRELEDYGDLAAAVVPSLKKLLTGRYTNSYTRHSAVMLAGFIGKEADGVLDDLLRISAGPAKSEGGRNSLAADALVSAVAVAPDSQAVKTMLFKAGCNDRGRSVSNIQTTALLSFVITGGDLLDERLHEHLDLEMLMSRQIEAQDIMARLAPFAGRGVTRLLNSFDKLNSEQQYFYLEIFLYAGEKALPLESLLRCSLKGPYAEGRLLLFHALGRNRPLFDKLLPDLVEILRGNDKDNTYGACAAIEKAAPDYLAPQIKEELSNELTLAALSDDRSLSEQAAKALKAIMPGFPE